ncbi:hypothetical protein QJS66_01010 [Kocuria rhizophila]|nr:hypothetical protein QJS66_01010 [Kocuria rhizophila]
MSHPTPRSPGSSGSSGSSGDARCTAPPGLLPSPRAPGPATPGTGRLLRPPRPRGEGPDPIKCPDRGGLRDRPGYGRGPGAAPVRPRSSAWRSGVLRGDQRLRPCRLASRPRAGRWADRMASAPTYLIGLIVVALSSAATAFAQTYWQLLVFRGSAGPAPPCSRSPRWGLIVRLAPRHMRRGRPATTPRRLLLGGNPGRARRIPAGLACTRRS